MIEKATGTDREVFCDGGNCGARQVILESEDLRETMQSLGWAIEAEETRHNEHRDPSTFVLCAWPKFRGALLHPTPLRKRIWFRDGSPARRTPTIGRMPRTRAASPLSRPSHPSPG